jgi:hypothetical protein
MNGRLDSRCDEDPANHKSENQKSKGGKQMSNKSLRVHFDLPEDLYEELMELENGKYPNITAYIRAITHDHLTKLIRQKRIDKAREVEILDKMYDDILG